MQRAGREGTELNVKWWNGERFEEKQYDLDRRLPGGVPSPVYLPDTATATRGDGRPTLQVNGGWNRVDFGESGLGGMNDCEKYLAKAFTGASDTMFSDVTDGDGRDALDPRADKDYKTYNRSYVETHNHGYNPVNDPARETSIYAPSGGVVIGGLVYDSAGQSVVNVFYRKFGNQSNIMLQFFHVENFKGGLLQTDGSKLLGTFGPNGSWKYPGGKDGYHYHVNAWKWWGKLNRRTGMPILGKGGVGFPSPSHRTLNNTGILSNLCPK